MAEPVRYGSTIAMERTDWRIPTIFPEGSPDALVGTEVNLVYDPPVAVTFEASWAVSAADRPRWSAGVRTASMYPAAVDPLASIYGVGWFHTRGGPPVSPVLSNHYTSGPIVARPADGPVIDLPGMAERVIPVLPLPWDNDFCPYCFDRLPVPWLVLPCRDADCSDVDATSADVALDDRLVLGDHPSFAPPGFEVLMTGTSLAGARWAAAPEPAVLAGEHALRLVAFDGATGATLRLLSASGGVLADYGKPPGSPNDPNDPNSPFATAALVPGPTEAPPPRSGFAVAASGLEASSWIVGGRAPSGEELHDVWRHAAPLGEWTRLDATGTALGRVHAVAYGSLDGRLYILDEVAETRVTRVRLLSMPANGGALTVEGSWPRLSRAELRALLAVDSDGFVWVAGSIGRSGAHAVARLRRDRHRRLVPAGFRVGLGALARDGAFATPRGLSLALIGRRGVPRIAGYSPRSLLARGGPESCF